MSLLRLSSKLLTNLSITDSITTRNVARWVGPTLRELKRRRKLMGPEALLPRSNYLEWNFNAEIFAFGKRLNEDFDSKLLEQAFTNRSYVVQEEMKQRDIGIEDPVVNMTDNSKLVEKGQEIISEYVEAFLLCNFSKLPQTGIKAIKKHLLSDEVLANVSSHLGTKEIILSAEYPVGEATLAATFKAVVGALEKSSGEEKAYDFVRDFVCTQLNQVDVNEYWQIDNPLQLLEEYCRDKKLGKPGPRLIGETGKNTILASYNVGIYCNKKLLGSGFGENIETAIDTAANDCLRELFQTQTNTKPINFKMSISELRKSLKQKTSSQ